MFLLCSLHVIPLELNFRGTKPILIHAAFSVGLVQGSFCSHTLCHLSLEMTKGMAHFMMDYPKATIQGVSWGHRLRQQKAAPSNMCMLPHPISIPRTQLSSSSFDMRYMLCMAMGLFYVALQKCFSHFHLSFYRNKLGPGQQSELH